MIRMHFVAVFFTGICFSAVSVVGSDNLQSFHNHQNYPSAFDSSVFDLKGDADYRLSGINLYRATIDDAITQFGTPTNTTRFLKIGKSLGGNDYEWNRRGLLMQLHTCGDGKTLCSIEARGKKANDNLGTTGHGLKLGSTMANVRRLYFPRFSAVPHDDTSQVTLVWGQTTMQLYFDDAGRINHIIVLRGPCHLSLFGCAPEW
jgi:hypothetical protein